MAELDADDEGYTRKVEELRATAARDLELARGAPARVRSALARFFKRGENAEFSTGELVDYLGVSSPTILELAGYTDEEATHVMDVVGQLTDEEITRVEI